MAWGRKLEKQDLVDAGLNLDDLNTKITSAATKADVDEIKTTVSGFADSLKELGNRLQSLSESRTSDSGDNSRGGDNSGGGSNNSSSNTPPDPLAGLDAVTFMENPVEAVKRIQNVASAPIVAHSLQMACNFAYNEAKRTLPNFGMFEEEIKKEWDAYPLNAKGADPDKLIKNLYDLVRGRHVDDIMTDTNKKEGKYNFVQSGASGGTGASGNKGPQTKPEDLLTPEELKQAARFDMTPAEYAEQKGKLRYA